MEAARDERGRDDNEELRGRLWQEVSRRRAKQARTSAECAARCECSTVEKGELVKLPNCVHHIHLDCLIQLAATGAGQCPLCRKPTTTSSEASHQVSQLRVQTRLLIELRMQMAALGPPGSVAVVPAGRGAVRPNHFAAAQIGEVRRVESNDQNQS